MCFDTSEQGDGKIARRVHDEFAVEQFPFVDVGTAGAPFANPDVELILWAEPILRILSCGR